MQRLIGTFVGGEKDGVEGEAADRQRGQRNQGEVEPPLLGVVGQSWNPNPLRGNLRSADLLFRRAAGAGELVGLD